MMGEARQHSFTVKQASRMFHLGVVFYFHFLLVGDVCHLFQVRVLDAVHQLDVLLQHQPLGEGSPGVRAVPAGRDEGKEVTPLPARPPPATLTSHQTAHSGGPTRNKPICETVLQLLLENLLVFVSIEDQPHLVQTEYVFSSFP